MSQRVEERISEKLNRIKVKDVMTRSVITTQEDETLSDLADLLIKKKISGVPVLNHENKIAGIITTTDFLDLMGKIKAGVFTALGEKAGANPRVKSVMTKNVVTITENHTLLDAVNIMCLKNIHTLPILKDDNLIGVLGRRDIIMYFYAAVRDSIEEVS